MSALRVAACFPPCPAYDQCISRLPALEGALHVTCGLQPPIQATSVGAGELRVATARGLTGHSSTAVAANSR